MVDRDQARRLIGCDMDGHSEVRACVRGRRRVASPWVVRCLIEGCYLPWTGSGGTPVTAQSPRPRSLGLPPPCGGAGAGRAGSGHHAVASSRVQRNSVPSAQMRCMTIASLRATATMALRSPRRFATAMPHAFSVDQRFARVSSAKDAW